MKKSLTNRLHWMFEGMSIDDHLTILKEIVTDLEMLKVKYDEEDLT